MTSFKLGDIVIPKCRYTNEPYIFLHRIRNGQDKKCCVLISLRDDHSLNVVEDILILIASADQVIESYRNLGLLTE